MRARPGLEALLANWTAHDQAIALPVTVAVPLLGCLAVLLLRRWPTAR